MITRYYTDDAVTLYHGNALDVLRTLPAGSVDCCVTSPPYFGLRNYGVDGQYGLEKTPAEYVENMRTLFADVRRVLANDATLWLNLGDSYSTTPKGSTGRCSTLVGSDQSVASPAGISHRLDIPQKNLLGIPWRTAFALQDDGWILRNSIVWAKPNAMPESVTDRLSTKHELIFLFSKSRRYWFDLDPIREKLRHPETTGHVFGGNHTDVGRRRGGTYSVQKQPPGQSPQTGIWADPSHSQVAEGGRNPGDVWEIPTQPSPGAHFAVFPVEIPRRCIAAGCKPGGTVLDPFSGSGTTGLAAGQLGRKYVGIDLNSDYLDLSLRTRLAQAALLDTGDGAA